MSDEKTNNEFEKTLVIKCSSEEYYGVDEDPVNIYIEVSKNTIKRLIGSVDEKDRANLLQLLSEPLSAFVGCLDVALMSDQSLYKDILKIITKHLEAAGKDMIRDMVKDDFQPATDKAGFQFSEDEKPNDPEDMN